MSIISIHALREEGDPEVTLPMQGNANFYPRPPRGGRPCCGFSLTVDGYISIHALREEGDGLGDNYYQQHRISIHALREEGDSSYFSCFPDISISIHALREEGDCILLHYLRFHPDFYPRPPRGGRRTDCRALAPFRAFLSTPSARRATPDNSRTVASKPFLSTPSARRATPSTVILHNAPGYFYPRPPRGGRPLYL